MKKFFAVRNFPVEVSTVFLIVRLVCGIAFMMHGFGKIQTPMSWMPPESPVPGIFQALAAISEFGGGLALILGLLTRLASFGITCTMIVAVMTHMVMLGDPFVSPTGGRSFELAAVYLSIALMFLVAGPGRISLDRKIFGLRS